MRFQGAGALFGILRGHIKVEDVPVFVVEHIHDAAVHGDAAQFVREKQHGLKTQADFLEYFIRQGLWFDVFQLVGLQVPGTSFFELFRKRDHGRMRIKGLETQRKEPHSVVGQS